MKGGASLGLTAKPLLSAGGHRHVNYYKIQYATLCIRENPGCLFIATNRDAVTHLTDAQEWAGVQLVLGSSLLV